MRIRRFFTLLALTLLVLSAGAATALADQTVSGTVSDAVSGKGVAGATVTAYSLDIPGFYRNVGTEADGTWSLLALDRLLEVPLRQAPLRQRVLRRRSGRGLGRPGDRRRRTGPRHRRGPGAHPAGAPPGRRHRRQDRPAAGRRRRGGRLHRREPRTVGAHADQRGRHVRPGHGAGHVHGQVQQVGLHRPLVRRAELRRRRHRAHRHRRLAGRGRGRRPAAHARGSSEGPSRTSTTTTCRASLVEVLDPVRLACAGLGDHRTSTGSTAST